MDHHPIGSESDTDEVDPVGADRRAKSANPLSLADVHGVDGVAITCDRAHFDCNPSTPVGHEQIDLTTFDDDIARMKGETSSGEPPGGDRFPGRTQLSAGGRQSFSSVFSSFSTLTSRKVSTCTFSRNRAGRNMSQTQASRITTSK